MPHKAVVNKYKHDSVGFEFGFGFGFEGEAGQKQSRKMLMLREGKACEVS